MATTATSGIDQAAVVRGARAEGTWRLDGEQSRIGFEVKNFWGLMTVKGAFGGATGAVEVHDDGAITAVLSIDASSVDTGNAKRDEHLRSKDFFDVEHFGELVVKIESTKLTGVGAATARGRITVLGQTRPVEVALSIAEPTSDGVRVVRATTVIDRGAFGMSWRPMRMAALEVKVDAALAFRTSKA